MQTDQITAALDAANIRHTPEAVAMLAECNAEPDWSMYNDARRAYYSLPGVEEGLIAAHPHMPETKAMLARIAELDGLLGFTQSSDLWPAPDPDGWIEWHGGECPVDGDVMVEVRLRNGDDNNVGRARFWGWKHARAEYSHDIIAYRVLP